jgi:hypothetical protein
MGKILKATEPAAMKNMSEAGLRSKAKRMGYSVKKSRRRDDLNNYGGFMIVNASTNFVEAGFKFDLSLADVESFLSDSIAEAA